MKMIAGVLVVVAAMWTACGSASTDAPVQGEDSASADPYRTSEAALTGDCTVSIKCADGTSRSCSGSSGACSASGSGYGSVTCNGVTTQCPAPAPTCTCNSDRCCNLQCSSSDPDCITCTPGAACTSNTQCGVDGACISKKCNCSVSVE